eukprot:CAMPEP_0169186036 /NCGR_PEP_ID=MMETSP1016-20121227/2131_1 /TAXON_ID=342587 /ORGANISM="Karlodinium micrum, Strain CCMP2283" /LENGTH=253 /DNA_ID=CAMNT_0009261811 /DNA_START=3 /DNA_END=764 /DNA_ORIENTATION=+
MSVEVHLCSSDNTSGSEEVLPIRISKSTRLRQFYNLVKLQLAGRSSTSGGYPKTEQCDQRPQSATQRIESQAVSLRLVFKGESLRDIDEDTPLSELGIVAGAVLHCVTSPKAKKEQRVSCYPHRCSTDGGCVVRICGEHFPFSTRIACRFGTVAVAAQIEDDGCEGGVPVLRCVAPPHPAGPVTVSVSFDGGVSWLDDGPTFWFIDSSSAACPLGITVPASCRPQHGISNTTSFGQWGMRWDHDRDPGGGGCV